MGSQRARHDWVTKHSTNSLNSLTGDNRAQGHRGNKMISLRDLWKNNRRPSICISGVSEKNASRAKTACKETIAENFPNMANNINSQISRN